MSCRKCGAPCQGSRCRGCEMQDSNEHKYGVPEDHFDDEEGDE